MNRDHTSPRVPGTYAAYRLDGCRCYPCSAARSAYDDRRARAIIAGTWQPFADAAPVREHLVQLAANGVGLRQIAAAVGVQRKGLGLILHDSGRRKMRQRVRTELADAILALHPTLDLVADHAPIDATGTRRRLRALVAVGYPADHLARRLGTVGSSNLRLDDDEETKVTAARAGAARALYDELSGRDPATQGIRVHSASRARNLAAARGWPRPIDWDDDEIDDPAARPHLTDAVGALDHAAHLAREARFLLGAGGVDATSRPQRDAVAARLEISTDHLNRLLKVEA